MTHTLVAPENDYRALLGKEVESPRLQVTVVIPVYNRVPLLERTLAGVATQTYPDTLLSVVVADDGSSEDVPGAVARAAGSLGVTIVRRDHEGYGAGQARNLGAAGAPDSDVLVFLDADCIPDPQTIQRHAVWHHLADNLVVIGSRHHVDTSEVTPADITARRFSIRRLAFGTEEPASDRWISEDYRKLLHRRTSSLRHSDMGFRSLVSSNFSVRHEVFARQGGFSEDFTRWGGEDTELGWRLWNDGAFFVDEPEAAIYHQLQEDEGDGGWREENRSANEGLIQSKIPHRHYRSAEAHMINEAPKVSVLVHDPDPARLEELARQILEQRLNDVEVLIADQSPGTIKFLERRHGDPRFRSAGSIEDALRRAKGEFVALVHGAVGLDHRLLSRSVAALEGRANLGWVRSAYGIPTTEGLEVYRREQDTSQLDEAWSGTIPLFGLTRRRELMKCLRAGTSARDAWNWVTQAMEAAAHGTPLVIVPSRSPADARPGSVTPPTSLRSMVLSDLKTGGRKAATAPVRAAKSVITGSPYRSTPVAPATPSPPADDRRPSVRYVGWTGRHNLGDEAMLQSVRELFSGSEVVTEGDRSDLLMLGGGTLINRGYLRHLRPLDSPRIERVAFGTGVANPEYWGEPKEKLSDWVDFLESCLYVGVRGPASAALLEDWGLKREVAVVGDPALSLTPGADIDRVEGRVVVCPAWSRGLLWGESDDRVIGAFARLVHGLKARGHEVWALSAFPGDDRYIIEMMRQAQAPDLPYLAAHDEAAEALDLLASAELVVSERLHGAVLAAAAGTVPVMVEYRPKLGDFARSVGLDDLVIRTDELEGGSLDELARYAYESRHQLAQKMMSRVDEFRSLQKEAAESIQQALTG